MTIDFWLGTDKARDRSISVSDDEHDLWLPIAQRPSTSRVHVDFWLEEETSAPSPPVSGLELINFALEWFTPKPAQRRVWDDELSRAETLRHRHARWMVELLDLPEPRERHRTLLFFEDLFGQCSAHQTFRALRAIAAEGTEARTMVAGCRFRLDALEHTFLLATRLAGGGAGIPVGRRENLISWRRACRMAALAGGDDPLDHLDDAWVDEWLGARGDDPACLRFIDFFEAKLEEQAAGCWNRAAAGLFVDAGLAGNSSDLADWRSRAGHLVFGPPVHIGVLDAPPPGLGQFIVEGRRFGVANHRVLGRAQQ